MDKKAYFQYMKNGFNESDVLVGGEREFSFFPNYPGRKDYD